MLGLLKVHKTGHWSMNSGGLSHTPPPTAGQGMHPASPVYTQFTVKIAEHEKAPSSLRSPGILPG
jgi:hypothetical protein